MYNRRIEMMKARYPEGSVPRQDNSLCILDMIFYKARPDKTAWNHVTIIRNV